MRKIPKRSYLSRTAGSGNTQLNDEKLDEPLSIRLAQNIDCLNPYLLKNKDIIVRTIWLPSLELEAVILYVEGLVDLNSLQQHVMEAMMLCEAKISKEHLLHPLDSIEKTLLSVGQVRYLSRYREVLHALFDGFTIILVDSASDALVVDIRGGTMRGISEPIMDRTLCGPREGFTENLVTNIAIIRRKLRDPNLVVEKYIVGVRSRSDVALLYVSDIADPKIVDEVKKRIHRINIDVLFSSGYINQLIEDYPYTIFPLERVIERGDTAVAELMEGRVVILVNESPLAIVFPALFVEMFQAAEDYYEKTLIGAFWRIFRFVAFIIAVSLPALYISLLSFEPQMIPFDLLVSLARNRQEVPFSVTFEVLVMELIIQLVIEAGLRLPSPIGQTIGVVTGIVLGQAAINSKLASPGIIMVVASTTVATFAIPNYCMAMATRVLRLPMILLAAMFGTFGFSFGWLIILTHLTSLESMGVPYFSPLAPTRYADLKDSVSRVPLFRFKQRPVSIPNKNPNRQGEEPLV